MTSKESLEDFVKFVKEVTGIVLNVADEHLVNKRIKLVKKEFSITDPSQEFYEGVLSDPEKKKKFITLVTNNESAFYRDKLPFEFLKNKVQEYKTPINILSLPCSFGQEPLSIMMSLIECNLDSKIAHISAWDIDDFALHYSTLFGFYKFELERGLSSEQIENFFTLKDKKYFPQPSLIEKIKFEQFNVVSENLPIEKFDIVFLRNLLIYFDDPTKISVLKKVTRALKDNGILILGNGEKTHINALKEHSWNGLVYYVKK